MNIQIVQRPEIFIAGPVAITPEVDSAVISRLWESYEELSEGIKHKGADVGYELHISEGRHYCLAGIEVSKVEDLPLGCFVKTIPAGKYAVFTHKNSEGTFTETYAQIDKWLKENAPEGSDAYDRFEVQVYDHRFKGMQNPETEIDFLIPLFKI